MMDWASGDDFRDGAVGVIAIFLGFWAFFFWPHMQKRVNDDWKSISDYHTSCFNHEDVVDLHAELNHLDENFEPSVYRTEHLSQVPNLCVHITNRH